MSPYQISGIDDFLQKVAFDGRGLVPAIAQQHDSGEVLMMAWMSDASLRRTLETGQVCYWSRSRQKLWRKGEESGNVQELDSLYFDCDRDTLLLKVRQIGGAACHLGYRTCFFRQKTPDGLKIVGERIFDPEEVYRK